MEFEENRSDLVYEKEYNLNMKPLEIDLLVIKKDPNVQIVNEIGKIFRGHNIIEYKSPNDEFDVDTFYKASAYGCLYKVAGETVNERTAEYIMGSVLFPTQIIVGKELKQTSHAWLKALSDKMQKQEMRELLERIGGLSRKYDKELADSVLEVSIRANKQIIEEMRVCARHY